MSSLHPTSAAECGSQPWTEGMEQLVEGTEKSTVAVRLGKTSNQGTTNLAVSPHFWFSSGIPWAGFQCSPKPRSGHQSKQKARQEKPSSLLLGMGGLLTIRDWGDPHFFSFLHSLVSWPLGHPMVAEVVASTYRSLKLGRRGTFLSNWRSCGMNPDCFGPRRGCISGKCT